MTNSAPNLILFNANVITMNAAQPFARVVAIRNSKIMKVSRHKFIKGLSGPHTEVIDCRGMTILPGFNDVHCHPIAFAESLIVPDLSLCGVHSISDMQEKIRKVAKGLPPNNWIRARGYDHFFLTPKRHPTRWDLDKTTTNHPVKLTHQTGHAHVLNSLALALCGISEKTNEPPGGIIERDPETGEPTGLLYNMGNYLATVVPPLSECEIDHGIKLANNKLLSLGITSIQDASPNNDERRWHLFQRWKARGYLKARVDMMLGIEAFRQCHEHGFPIEAKYGQLNPGTVKIMLDETTGQINPPQKELNQQVLEVHRSGFQVALHAVEDATVRAAISAVENALSAYPRLDHRHRIEHCSICTRPLAEYLASLGMVVVTQPAFIYYNGERYLRTVPENQLNNLYPVATLINSGVRVAASSDCPVVPPNPIIGIYASISRRANTGRNLPPKERISPLEAVRMYTDMAAYVCFKENVRGSIAPGKLADLVMLSDDPTRINPRKITDIEVQMTIADGKVVWRRGR